MPKRWMALSLVLAASAAPAQQIGPAAGTLVVVGGGLKDPAITERFVDLAGGPTAPIVVIPTAGGEAHYDDFDPDARRLREMGVASVTVMHTVDRAEADSEAFVEPLRRARGVWFPGGRQWRLADSYLGTRTERELHALLDRGGVIGGTSAGATIQGSYLARGDSRTNTIMMGDHETGFGFLKNVAIDQHLLARNRQFDLIGVVEKHPELLGIGIDEDTALVVRGDHAEVIGRSYVAIYDNRRSVAGVGKFYLLGAGDAIDLATRVPTRRAMSEEPFRELLREEPWQ